MCSVVAIYFSVVCFICSVHYGGSVDSAFLSLPAVQRQTTTIKHQLRQHQLVISSKQPQLKHCTKLRLALSILDHQNDSGIRRSMLVQASVTASSALGIAAATTAPASAETTPAKVIRSSGCYQGTGDACNDLAGSSQLVKDLQAKSVENRERNEKEAKDAFYAKNYPDFFATVGKVMIQRQDGSYMIVSDDELSVLKRSNKLDVRMPKAMGGRTTDLTQKPIFVLKE